MTRVAAIIPAFGRPEMLDQCLAALIRSDFPRDQIIVVDDATPDHGLRDVIETHGVKVISRSVNGGPAAARNTGVAALDSDAEILLFVDSDVLIAPSAWREMVSALARPDVAAVFGCYDDAPAASGLVSQYVNLRHREIHRLSAGDVDTFWAGCGAVRRSAFEAVGGFDETRFWNFIEDVELGDRLRRAGFKIRLDPDIQGKHLKRWTLLGAARTDALHRARPLCRLMLDNRRFWRGPNADHGGGVSLLAAALIPLGLGLTPFAPQAALAALAGFLAVPALNARLFHRFARLRGPGFALACAPLHVLHLICVGVGFLVGIADATARRLAQGAVGVAGLEGGGQRGERVVRFGRAERRWPTLWRGAERKS